MKCDHCGRYHRDFVPCDALPKERQVRAMCDFCPDAPWRQLTPLPRHPATERYMANEGIAVAQCPRCGAIWFMRYQSDAGAGSDKEAWVHEVGKEDDHEDDC